MNISLTSEAEQFIQQQLKSGRFSSVNEVIDAGIKLLEEREQIYQGRFEELKQEVQIGIDQLDQGEAIDGETFMQNLRAKLHQNREQSPE